MYEEEGKKDDSLVEVLRDLADFNLFWSHGSEINPIEKVSNRSFLVDVHAMPVLKELVGYLIIERLYKEMASLPGSPVQDGRSKGIVVFFASQSPNDYQQTFFNIQELLKFAYIFQCEGVSAGSIQDILGCGNKTAKDLQTEIARLEPFQVIATSNDKSEEFMKFSAEAFYKNY